MSLKYDILLLQMVCYGEKKEVLSKMQKVWRYTDNFGKIELREIKKQGQILGKFSALTNTMLEKDALLDKELIELLDLHRVAMEYNQFGFFLNEKYGQKSGVIKTFDKQQDEKNELHKIKKEEFQNSIQAFLQFKKPRNRILLKVNPQDAATFQYYERFGEQYRLQTKMEDRALRLTHIYFDKY